MRNMTARMVVLSVFIILLVANSTINAEPGCLETSSCPRYYVCDSLFWCDATPSGCNYPNDCGCCLINLGGGLWDENPCYCVRAWK